MVANVYILPLCKRYHITAQMLLCHCTNYVSMPLHKPLTCHCINDGIALPKSSMLQYKCMQTVQAVTGHCINAVILPYKGSILRCKMLAYHYKDRSVYRNISQCLHWAFILLCMCLHIGHMTCYNRTVQFKGWYKPFKLGRYVPSCFNGYWDDKLLTIS